MRASILNTDKLGSSKTTGDFPEVLVNFKPVISQTQPVHLQLAVGFSPFIGPTRAWTVIVTLFIAHPHLLVRATNERFLPSEGHF
jgi:hypothetical protein